MRKSVSVRDQTVKDKSSYAICKLAHGTFNGVKKVKSWYKILISSN